MWPFNKTVSIPPSGDFSKDGITARYDTKLKHWVFEKDGIEFNLSGVPFDENAFEWSRQAASVIRALEVEIRARANECIWQGNKAALKILSVDLDDYQKSKTIDVAFIGDETWGDWGVNVIITDGKIVDAYGGD